MGGRFARCFSSLGLRTRGTGFQYFPMIAPSQLTVLRWYLCHTMPRCEKKFAKLLLDKGKEYYLPLLLSSRKYPGSGTKSFSKPLYSGYVFAKLNPEEKSLVHKRELLVRLIWIEDQERFLSQLAAVKRVLEAGVAVTLEPLFEKGQMLTIKAGPFKGLEALVDDPRDPRGIQVVIDVMDRALRLPLDPAWLV